MDQNVLRAIVQTHMKPDAQQDVEKHLANGREDLVVLFILGGLDGACDRGTIDEEEARRLYEKLGISWEEVSRLRQRRTLKAS